MDRITLAILLSAILLGGPAPAGARERRTVTLQASGISERKISDKLMGFNIVYAKTPDSVWEDDVLADGIKSVHPGFLRYPGGTVNTFFHFETPTGQGWKDNWDPGYDNAINADPTQYTDIDEYFALVDRLGAEPLVGINTNSAFVYDRLEDGIAEALRLMQYCRDKGYKVKYWYLGNEPYAKDGNGGRVGPELYARMVNAFAPPMRAFDPDIQIIANCKTDLVGDRANWDTFFKLAKGNFDLIDIHWYNMWGHATWEEWLKRTPQGNWKGDSYEKEMDNFRQLCRDHGLKDIPLCTLEWNVGPGRKENGSILTVGQSALAQGEMMMQFMRGGVFMATFWPLFWDGDFCTRGFYDRKTGTLNPVSEVLASLSSFQGLTLIDLESGDRENTLSLAAVDRKTGLCRVCILNKNAEPLAISLQGMLPKGLLKVSCESYHISSDTKTLEHRMPGSEKVKRLTAQPYSLTLLSFENPAFKEPVEDEYRIVFGNTHAHCNFSGDIEKMRAKKGLPLDPANSVDGHFRRAKAQGYDFYFVTDHSQYPCYTETAWKMVASCAKSFTDDHFVGLRGYEHSENDGPDGKGHMNIYASDRFLNALADGIGIAYLHDWLAGETNPETFACFNHPQENAYNDFHCYNEGAREKYRLMELVNGNNAKFYPAFLNALSKGWKVSPVAGCDNHGVEGIAKWKCRTGLLVTELTPEGVLDAMRSRRTFATMDRNLSVRYSVNGHVMGSDIPASRKYSFDIEISDPDGDQVITGVEIVGEGGEVLYRHEPRAEEGPSNLVRLQTDVRRASPYYFVLVYTKQYSDHPTAFAAPVWTN